jgi:hypothetical protein
MTEQESRAPFEASTQAREAPTFGLSRRLADALVLSAAAMVLGIGERADLD